jgi:hypothetical protein
MYIQNEKIYNDWILTDAIHLNMYRKTITGETIMMERSQMIITILGILFGSGGIAAFISAIYQKKKINAESYSIYDQSSIDKFKAINEQLEDIADRAVAQSQRAAERNEALNNKINDLIEKNNDLNDQVAILNRQLSNIISWINNEDMSYKQWIKQELSKYVPEDQLPALPTPPTFSGIENNNQ